MLSPLSNTIREVMRLTWPTMFISLVILIFFRITYLYKNKMPFVFYKEVLMLSFVIYILCLFQMVTFRDVSTFSRNNFVLFKEILRYNWGSPLFIKNVLGNILMFLPYGFYMSYYLKLKKIPGILVLTLATSTLIETMQLSIGRCFDVDDILLNVIGGLIGYGIYVVFMRTFQKLPKIFHSSWLRNVLAIIIFIGTICILL